MCRRDEIDNNSRRGKVDYMSRWTGVEDYEVKLDSFIIRKV